MTPRSGCGKLKRTTTGPPLSNKLVNRSNIYYHVWLIEENGQLTKTVKEVPVEFASEGSADKMLKQLDAYITNAFSKAQNLNCYGYVISTKAIKHYLYVHNGRATTGSLTWEDFSHNFRITYSGYTLEQIWCAMNVSDGGMTYKEQLSFEIPVYYKNVFREYFTYLNNLNSSLSKKCNELYVIKPEDATNLDMLSLYLFEFLHDAFGFNNTTSTEMTWDEVEKVTKELPKANEKFWKILEETSQKTYRSDNERVLFRYFWFLVYETIKNHINIDSTDTDEVRDRFVSVLFKSQKVLEQMYDKCVKMIEHNSTLETGVEDFDKAFTNYHNLNINSRTAKLKATMTVPEEKLGELFDEFNKEYFDRKCVKVPVVYDAIQSSVYGLNKSSVKRIEGKLVGIPRWIKITCKYKLDEYQTKAILLHEMIHNYMSVYNPYEYVHESHGLTFEKWCKVLTEESGIEITIRHETDANLKRNTSNVSTKKYPVIIAKTRDKYGSVNYLLAKTTEKYLPEFVTKIDAWNEVLRLGKARGSYYEGGYLFTDQYESVPTVRTFRSFNVIDKEAFERLKEDPSFVPFQIHKHIG